MALEFVPVKTEIDQEILAGLAGEIWTEYWPDRIGSDQTIYMVQQFQSLSAIRRDMAEHDYEYWFLIPDDDCESPWKTADGRPIAGFTGGHVEPETNRFFISKIYLLAPQRGKHYATRVIAFYTQLCQDRGLHAMYLTVNKYNEMGIRAYKAKGFETIDSVESDIGHGYIMDDFIMEKQA